MVGLSLLHIYLDGLKPSKRRPLRLRDGGSRHQSGLYRKDRSCFEPELEGLYRDFA